MFEPFVLLLRYFKTWRWYTFFTTVLPPVIICIILGVAFKEPLIESGVDFISISSIIIGFCAAILIMLFTINGENIDKLKEQKLNKSNVSLFQAIVYKFVYVSFVMLILIIVSIIFSSINQTNNMGYKLYAIFTLCNSLIVVMEALSNTTWCMLRKTESKENNNGKTNNAD